jgi:hypothetical protein
MAKVILLLLAYWNSVPIEELGVEKKLIDTAVQYAGRG